MLPLPHLHSWTPTTAPEHELKLPVPTTSANTLSPPTCAVQPSMDHESSSEVMSKSATILQGRRIRELNPSEKGKYYRALHREHAALVEDQVQRLQQEVAELRAVRKSLRMALRRRRICAMQRLISILLSRYFALFRFGVDLIEYQSTDPYDLIVFDLESNRVLSDQKQILGRIMMETVQVNISGLDSSSDGISQVLAFWNRFNRSHTRIKMERTSPFHFAGTPASPVVIVSTTIRGCLTRSFLSCVLGQVDDLEAILNQLLGLRVVYPTRHFFYFDTCHYGTICSPRDKITRYDVEVDLFAGLCDVVSDLRLVSLLVEGMQKDLRCHPM